MQKIIIVVVVGIFVITVSGMLPARNWVQRKIAGLENMYVMADDVQKSVLAAKIWAIDPEWVPREIVP